MLKFTTENPTILEFLSKYPSSQHQVCLESIILYGIRSIKSKFQYSLSSSQLASISGLTPNPSHKQFSSSFALSSNRSTDHVNLYNSFKNEEITERLTQSKWETPKPFKFPTIKEPQTAPYETASGFMPNPEMDSFESENEVMKIADNFLKSSYNFYLSNRFR